MRPAEFLRRLRRGERTNVRYADVERLVLALGFVLDRQPASHRIYVHPSGARLNLQSLRGEAKPYQLKQLLRTGELFGLELERDHES